MANFVIKSKINALLKSNGKAPLVEINFLGTGGAFDLEEKNSSVIIKTSSGSILIDCGSTVYSVLRNKNLVDSIDYIFITHCHEDHIGSLSTLIYHKYFIQKQPARIECIPSLEQKIRTYLVDICGHSEDSFIINSNNELLYKDLNMIIHKVETTGYHFKDYESSGFVFNLRKGGENLFIIYSGDINTPITEIIKESNESLYESLFKTPDNVFIFHESTSRYYPPSYPHCDYKKLEGIVETFPNIYTYHHSLEETKEVSKITRNSKMKLDSIIRAIDFDLNKKLYLIKKYENKERIRVQAKRMKDDFTEDFTIPQLNIKDLNNIGTELVIQEEMGL